MLSGDGRLDVGRYEFKFDLVFPDKIDLPSSIDVCTPKQIPAARRARVHALLLLKTNLNMHDPYSSREAPSRIISWPP